MDTLPGVRALPADITRDEGPTRALDGADAVVMCTEQDGGRVARACLERGMGYVDVSASAPRLRAVAALDGLARRRGATAVLSVGLAPGVTNLLARSATDAGGAGPIRMGVLVGAGEHHGPGALDWILDSMEQAGGPSRLRFPPPYGVRTAYRFPFSDQYTLPETLGAPAAETALCLDTRVLTPLLATARRPVAARLLRRPRVRAAVRRALLRVHAGGDGFAVTAARGPVTAWFSGRSQSRASGVAAALAAGRLPGLAPGVHHIEQAVEPVGFLTELAGHGFELGLPEGVLGPGSHYDAQ
ncbi:hypothetical protein GCM10023224_44980 [Streptomonospora halophila]|uniref:Saccharopine dehydrogenase n=1 Tax=Streptomonospora halophila TaxID=427369 RepID=A0ABP9GVX9_9ACTN